MIIIPTPQIETEPEGSEPEKKVCRPPQQLADSRLMGPEVCLSRQEWDRIKQQGLQLMPDGRSLVVNLEKEPG